MGVGSIGWGWSEGSVHFGTLVWLLFVSGLCVSVSCACVGLLKLADRSPVSKFTDTDKRERERPETMVQRASKEQTMQK